MERDDTVTRNWWGPHSVTQSTTYLWSPDCTPDWLCLFIISTVALIYIHLYWMDELQQHFRMRCPWSRDSRALKEQPVEEGLESGGLNQLNGCLQRSEAWYFSSKI